MKRFDVALRWLPVATALVLFVLLAVRPIQDHDVWWHLRTGAHVLDEGLPGNDVLTHTRTDHPWVVPDWLCDVLLFEAHRLGGPAALTLFKVAMLGAAFLVLLRIGRLRGVSPVAFGVALTLAVLVARVRFLERPLVFKFLFSGLWVWGLESYRLHGRRWFWWLLPLQAVWVNVHSSFVVGPAMPLGYALGLCVERRLLRREGTRSPWPCAAFALACVVASLCDPRGPSTLLYPFRLGSTTVLREATSELEPLGWLHFVAEPSWAWSFVALATVWAVSIAAERRRAPLCDLAVALPFLWLGVNSVRFLALWAYLVVPAVALHLGAIGRRVSPAGSGAWRAAALLPAAAVAALFAWPRGLPTPRLAFGVDPQMIPVAAADYLARRDLRGNAFNTFELGGYLEWARPEVKTFVDGRGMVFGDDFLQWYIALNAGGPALDEALRRHGVTIAVMSSAAWTRRGLAAPAAPFRTLFPPPSWRLVHFDDLACVYLEDAPANAAAIRADAYEVFDPSDTDVDRYAGSDLAALSRDFDRCLERDPSCGRARYFRALVAMRREDYDAAGRDLEEVTRAWPMFGAAHYRLGGVRLLQGRVEDARAELERARAVGGSDPMLDEMLRQLDGG